jgi:hypothetical protein
MELEGAAQPARPGDRVRQHRSHGEVLRDMERTTRQCVWTINKKATSSVWYFETLTALHSSRQTGWFTAFKPKRRC